MSIPWTTRVLSDSEKLAVEDMYSRQHDFTRPLGFCTVAKPLAYRTGWNPDTEPDTWPRKTIPVGQTLRIVLASTMGDCGLSDNLAEPHGYGIRLFWDDDRIKDLRLAEQTPC